MALLTPTETNVIEAVLLTATRVLTFNGMHPLTNATGFFYESDERLFLVTSRHILIDRPSRHFPDRIEIELHDDPDNLAVSTQFSIPLYREGVALWREASDSAGTIDVAAIEIDRGALPSDAVYRAFGPAHVPAEFDQAEVGSSVLVIGFPLGFHDTLHHIPVARHAIVASSFGLRFQGKGYFLTDARTHRGSSGSPVVMRIRDDAESLGDLPWVLLGIHSARLEVGSRNIELDERLGLNCAWYADVLPVLTARDTSR